MDDEPFWYLLLKAVGALVVVWFFIVVVFSF